MEELLFKKGQLANLPTERQSGTFYVTEDAKTIYIDNMVIQDTEDVKEELIGIIVDNELVTAEGLTYLYDNKADITALEALGDRIPVKTSQLTNDSGYITANEIPEMDLDGYSKTGHTHDDLYYTETEINTKLSGKQDTISDLGTIRSGAALGATALQSIPEEYATKTYVGEEVSKLVGSAPETLNTLEELAQALDNNADIVSVLNDAIANKANIDDLSAYTTNALHEELKAEVEENEYVAAQALTKLENEKANKSDIPTSLSQLTNDSGFITASEVPNQDLSGYVTTEALEAKGYLTSVPSEYVTETELDNKGYLTSVPSEYITETELENKGYLTSVPSEYVTEDMLSGYTSTEKFDELYNGVIDNELVISKALIQLDADKANVSDIPTNISELNNDKGYITIADIPQQDLTDYALKTEIPTKVSSLENDSNFITQEAIDTLQNSIDSLVDEVEENEYVSAQALTKLENEKANKSDIPTSLSQLTNDSGFITASEVPNQDLSGYATIEALSNKQDTLVSGTNIKTINGESLLGSGDITITSGGISDEDLQEIESKIPTKVSQLTNDSGFITASEVPSQDLSGYVTTEALEAKGYLTSVPSEYVTETELTNKGYLTSVPAEYITETELANKNYASSSYVIGELAKKSDTGHTHSEYLTEHQDVSGKADKSSLATVATSGSYNDLTDKPTIPASVTESTVSGWGFTKNTGTYSKPSNGIPKSDLASDVQASLGNAVTKSYVDRQINAALSGRGIIPSYVTTGCERIAENILRTRNAYSFVMGAISDLHTTGSDSSASGVEHACLAFNEINKLTQLDMIANLGDVMKGYMDDINDEGFKFVKQQMDAVAKSVPVLQLEGNHDDLSDLSTEDMKQKAFAYIGANNVNVVTDFNNRYRNYGYKDFDDLRFRVIYLNTTDCTEYEVTENIRISPTQLSWLVNTATNFSNKTEPSTWHFIVLSHVPLNAQYESIAALQTILKAMVSKSSGTVSVEGTNISYNFGSLAQKLVCHIHGHIHNFRTEWFDDLLSITVPNACFERNNEYGMLHESETIRNIFGDVDKDGNQRQFNKTQSSGEDTAFNVFVIDSRVNNKIYAYNYGAGINRTINLTTKEVTESSYESIGGEVLPDGIYINSIPSSTIIGGSEIYNDGLGYKNDTYISSSTGGDSSSINHFATGVMHYPMQLNYTPDIYILGADVNLDDSYTRMGFYNETGLVRFVATNDISNYFEVVKLADKYYKLKVLYRGTDKSDGQGMSNIGYNHGVISGVRISLPGTGEDVIVSIQNPIVSSIFEGIEWVEYTNQVPTSQDTSGNIYNEGLGYKEDYRLGSSGGESTNTGSIISGFIPYNGEVIRAYGSTSFKPDATGYYIIFYDSAFNMELCAAATRINSDPGVYFEEIDRRCVFTIDPSLSTASDIKSATTYPWFRVSLPLCSHHKFVVTLNEKLIVETETDE